MCKNKIRRYEQIELQIPVGAGTKVPIGDQTNLRNQSGQAIIVRDIEVITAAVLPTTPNGATNAPLAELKKAVLVLYVNGEESVQRIPLLKLNRINDGASPYQEQFESFDDLRNVDWSKSYILFSSAPATTPYSILLGVSYLKLAQ